MSTLFPLIVTQALLGALDKVWHHEIVARPPARRAAARELALDAARELLYAFLFMALAWAQWRGAWAALIVLVVGLEIVVTLAAFIVEDRTRRLARTQRILHTVRAINVGAVLAVLAPALLAWWRAPSAIVPVSHGAYSAVLSAFAAAVFICSLRDAAAVLRHRRPPQWVRDPVAVGASPSARTLLVTGATGFIGGHLVRRLLARGDRVIVLSRDADKALDRFGPHVHAVTDLTSLSPETPVDAVVNLAGAPILGLPWTRARRRALRASRVDTTREVVALCARLARAPEVLVSASAIGYYGVHDHDDVEVIDERSPPQAIFQSQLCRDWEAAAIGAESLGVRVVRLRIGLVFGRDGGALPMLARPVRLRLGAILGSGKQYLSWIHIEDLLRIVDLALDTPSLRGAVNAVGPQPSSHTQVQRALGTTLQRSIRLRLPAWLPRLLLGEMAQLLVDGQRVFPRQALRAGFVFRHPHLRGALYDLLVAPAPAPRTGAAPAVLCHNGDCPLCAAEIAVYAKRYAESHLIAPAAAASRGRHYEALEKVGGRAS